MKSKIDVPAVSPELQFMSEHWEEFRQVIDQRIPIKEPLLTLATRVEERANDDYEFLLDQIAEAVTPVPKASRVNSWRWTQDRWTKWSEIYRGRRGPKQKVASVHLNIGYGNEDFRLIGWVALVRGGQDARRRLVESCKKKKKLEHVHSAEEQPTRYPDWRGRCVIWLDIPLTLTTSLVDLRREATDNAGRFFKALEAFIR